jgi:hypothetical protein
VHRRAGLAEAHFTRHDGIPVTTPVCTIADLAGCLPRDEVEAAINAADRAGLTDPEALRRALDELPARRGAAAQAPGPPDVLAHRLRARAFFRSRERLGSPGP